ncbi:hypothetical protein PHLH6_31610 [Pseudomonas sp. Seg1]|jgi:hypothetical protein|uniref:hypothetical protein n=1 Tax=Pseudomonas sp. Seg1 TaxID=2678259 RepID=UPI001BB32EBE|nr:hypothetical protein [Pseudomonas sp. Seg1]BBP71157.1 hypothetical protein PHLH6_31610 [Pseudomonas sp. Seg1]
MTTAPVKSLIDDQLADIERSLAVIGAGIPRDLPVAALPPKLVAAIKSGRIAVRSKS